MLNNMTIQGRLVDDVKMGTTQCGFIRGLFKVAWSEKYNDKETKCFLQCRSWNKQAETISQYFRKGSPIIVEGRLVTEDWGRDGNHDYVNILEVQRFHFEPRNTGNQAAAPTETPADNVPEAGFMKVDESAGDFEDF